eukprot:COSAG01_NODE_45900_length_405_cov_0.800654_1_plen_61_part_10
MGVFPAASAHCLPPACRELMESAGSPIIDFYPPSFALDPNGQKRKWQVRRPLRPATCRFDW